MLSGGGKNGQPLINPEAFIAPPHDPVTGLTYRYGNEGRGRQTTGKLTSR
jgi:hypothetical protein